MPVALVVEDDLPTSQMFAELLPSIGYEVVPAASGREGLELAATRAPDVILLDLGLPDVPGTTVIRRLREWTDTPIIVVSGSRLLHRKADSLDAGADDFIDKPFDVSELRARINAAERRSAVVREQPTRRSFSGLVVDYTERRVHRGGSEIHLTDTEWQILEGISREPGRVVTHRWLVTHVWGPHSGTETHATMRAHVKSLRAKLGDDAREPRYIRTETGIGYRWLARPDQPARARPDSLERRLDTVRDDVRRWIEHSADIDDAEAGHLMGLLDDASQELTALSARASTGQA